MPHVAGMFARRTGIALAVIALTACGALALAVLRGRASPAAQPRGGAAAVAPALPRTGGCRVSLAVPGTARSGLVMVATNVRIDPRTGAILGCSPVLGNGPLTFDLRYAPGRTARPIIAVPDPHAPFGGVPG